jgi:tetratricopeptide (TPR) repeat protein
LLESLQGKDVVEEDIQQELARAYNNLARLLRRQGRQAESQQFYERAIGIHEALSLKSPVDREYKLELASFYNNLAVLLQERTLLDDANRRNRQALDLFETLAEPIPAVGIEMAHAHNLRGRILEDQGSPADAQKEYEQAIGAFERLAGSTNSADFHLRFGQALFNLSSMRQAAGDLRGAAGLASRAASEHSAAGSATDLAYDYLLLTQIHLDAGSLSDARASAASLSATLPELSEADRSTLSGALERMRNRLEPDRR